MTGKMAKCLTVLTVLILLTLELAPQPSIARFLVKDVRRRPQRRLLDSIPDGKPSTSEPTVTAEMIPYHHVRSPFYQPNLSRAERLAISAQRSRARGMRINRRLSDDEADSAYTSPGVYYNQGSYVMNFTIGSPSRTFLAIADTGSDLCWVQCQGCAPCFQQPDTYFDPTSSSTYDIVACTSDQCSQITSSCDVDNGESCQYQYGYGDSSETDGTLSTETLTLFDSADNPTTFSSFYFGCGYNETGNFGDTDGLVGLGQGPISLVSQLGDSINYTFSYCLVDDTQTDLTSALLLGSEGSLDLNYTSLLPNPDRNPTFYFVDLQAISVGDISIDYPADTFVIDPVTGGGGIILDSGTTLTILADPAYQPLVTELNSQVTYSTVDATQYGYDYCYDTSSVTAPEFPTVSFTLGTLVLSPEPSTNIFIKAQDDGSVYCLSLTSTPSGQTSIFGNIWQQNYQIAYNLQDQTVGFAVTTCGQN